MVNVHIKSTLELIEKSQEYKEWLLYIDKHFCKPLTDKQKLIQYIANELGVKVNF